MYLLFDIGGTNMRLATSTDGKTLDEVKIVATPKDFETGIKIIRQLSGELLNGKQITKVAGGIAGPLNKERSMLVASPHVSGWVNKPLKQSLEQIFGVEVLMENDTTLSSLGEAVYGAGKGYSIIGFIGVGTGVGGAKIINGKVDQNNLGFEIGHQIIKMDDKICHCGGKGHLESYVAGGYFQENYGIEAKDLTAENKEEISKNLAIGLNNIAVHWSPEVIILGGSVINSLSLESMQKYFDQALTIFPQKIKLFKAELEDKSGLYGALHLVAS